MAGRPEQKVPVMISPTQELSQVLTQESIHEPVRARLPGRALSVAALALVGLSACTDPAALDPNTDPNRNTKAGAIGGAILGAGVGLVTGGDQGLKNAAVGATAGAILGAGAGSLLDRQATEIRQSLASDGITVVNEGNRLVVTLPQDITFATDSADIRPVLQSELVKLAQNFVKYRNSNLQVVGHTDNTGEAAYNQTLSEQRAGAVSAVLINNGVEPNRIRTVGAGENQPVASNLTPEGRAQNRRVEIIVVPKQGL